MKISDYLWEFLYNKFSVNSVLIISREDFEVIMNRIKMMEGEKEQ